MWIPHSFFFWYLHTCHSFLHICKVRCGVRKLEMMTNQSWLVVRDKHLQKGPWGSSGGEMWACMLNLRSNLRVFPPGKDQDSWNLCGSNSVVFHSVSEGNKLRNCSLCHSLPVIRGACYTTQHNWTEQERSQDTKCSHILWKSLAGQRQEVFAPFKLPI